MFKEARIKLTIWYVVITLMITGSMSLLIYRGTTQLLEHRFEAIGGRFRSNIGAPALKQRLLSEAEELDVDLKEIKRGLVSSLLVLNGSVLFLVAIGGYIFAGEVLDPIRKNHEKEKRFVADASHELRTPLTALITGVEVALRDKKISKSEVVKVLEENLEDLERLKGLSDRLLSLSRTEEGIELKKSWLEVGGSLDEAVKMMKIMAKEKGVEMEVVKTGKAKVKADKELLSELWTILLDNAVKYSRKKGRVVVKMAPFKTGVRVEIEDEGKGVGKKDLPHVFERFYRADKARGKDGFGLGLALAKQIVERHGGTISLESEGGKGTKVKVFLPKE